MQIVESADQSEDDNAAATLVSASRVVLPPPAVTHVSYLCCQRRSRYRKLICGPDIPVVATVK